MDGRLRLSGCEYRKRAEEKRRRDEEVTQKTKSIETFFIKKKLHPLTEGGEVHHSNESEPTAVPAAPNVEEQATDVLAAPNGEESAAENQDGEDLEQGQVTSALYSLRVFNYCEDPAMWIVNDELRDFVAENGFSQNLSSDFKSSKRVYADQARYFNPNLLKKELPNGEVFERQWPIYSEGRGSIFCGPCLLLSAVSSSFCSREGFNDWKNARHGFEVHEQSSMHRDCVLSLKTRGSKKNLSSILDEERALKRNYWKEVVKRVVVVVRKLTNRGLPLRGSSECIGALNNGNFLMAIEMLAEFDPFTAEHLGKYGRPGRGGTNYLSSTAYEEIVSIKADMCRQVISDEIKAAKYFSIIVDSTPDIAHVDQLAVVFRYVRAGGTPVEVFYTFIPNTGHKAEELFNAVTHLLESVGIDLSNCRGQSYDNASNMAGAYSGLQARIKAANEVAEYIPCSAHALNLIGDAAAGSCTESDNFFLFLQNIYNFFSASPSRWDKLEKRNVDKTLKSLSTTRWSCRDDACESLLRSWDPVRDTLESMAADPAEKAIARAQAKGLFRQMMMFRTAFLTVFWGKTLNRVNAVSKKLQKVDADVGLVIDLYDSTNLVSGNSSRKHFNL